VVSAVPTFTVTVMGVVPVEVLQVYVAGMVAVAVSVWEAWRLLAPIASANIATIVPERLTLKSGGFMKFHPFSYRNLLNGNRP
jgi:hypothetical protein